MEHSSKEIHSHPEFSNSDALMEQLAGSSIEIHVSALYDINVLEVQEIHDGPDNTMHAVVSSQGEFVFRSSKRELN